MCEERIDRPRYRRRFDYLFRDLILSLFCFHFYFRYDWLNDQSSNQAIVFSSYRVTHYSRSIFFQPSSCVVLVYQFVCSRTIADRLLFVKGALFQGKRGPPDLEKPARHFPRRGRGLLDHLYAPDWLWYSDTQKIWMGSWTQILSEVEAGKMFKKTQTLNFFVYLLKFWHFLTIWNLTHSEMLRFSDAFDVFCPLRARQISRCLQ